MSECGIFDRSFMIAYFDYSVLSNLSNYYGKRPELFFNNQGSKGMYSVTSVLTMIAKDRMVSWFRSFR